MQGQASLEREQGCKRKLGKSLEKAKCSTTGVHESEILPSSVVSISSKPIARISFQLSLLGADPSIVFKIFTNFVLFLHMVPYGNTKIFNKLRLLKIASKLFQTCPEISSLIMVLAKALFEIFSWMYYQ